MLQRRTFLKAISAAAWAPLIALRPEVDREKLMMAFCDPDDHRYDLSQPFGSGSLTYATDRYAMIRGELVNRQEVGERRTPRVEPVWKKHWHPTGNWIGLDPQVIQPTITRDCGLCPQCGDARVSGGEHYPDFRDKELVARLHKYDFDVDENTIRDSSCTLCHGLNYNGPTVTELVGIQHYGWYLHRIASLPNAIVCRSASVVNALLFRADGFEGISLGIQEQ